MTAGSHAEHVGSLLRPGYLLEARAAREAGTLTADDLCRRIDEAARFVPLENLAVSPQCGFASGSLGNLITPDDQRRKLGLVVSAARQVWG